MTATITNSVRFDQPASAGFFIAYDAEKCAIGRSKVQQKTSQFLLHEEECLTERQGGGDGRDRFIWL
jgi:hypothetical protein